MIIVGAGLAGLITAHAFPRMGVVEAGEPGQAHRALLRFRSEAVSDLVGVPFRQVTVRKGIFLDGGFQQPSIAAANLYAQKCLGELAREGSLWNQEPVRRFIAPEDFYQQLVENLGGRIAWGTPFDYRSPCISTAPLPVVARALGLPTDHLEFKRAGITVRRWRVPGADVFQTVYFPSREHGLYRASITGDLLIAEFTDAQSEAWRGELESAFALSLRDAESLGVSDQRYGKISPINEADRRALVHDLSVDHGVYSIGRFATWRNVLLDDLVKDTKVVKHLLANDRYAGRIKRSV